MSPRIIYNGFKQHARPSQAVRRHFDVVSGERLGPTSYGLADVTTAVRALAAARPPAALLTVPGVIRVVAATTSRVVVAVAPSRERHELADSSLEEWFVGIDAKEFREGKGVAPFRVDDSVLRRFPPVGDAPPTATPVHLLPFVPRARLRSCTGSAATEFAGMTPHAFARRPLVARVPAPPTSMLVVDDDDNDDGETDIGKGDDDDNGGGDGGELRGVRLALSFRSLEPSQRLRVLSRLRALELAARFAYNIAAAADVAGNASRAVLDRLSIGKLRVE